MDFAYIALGLCGGVVLVIWASLRRTPSKAPKTFVAFVTALTFSSLMPGALSLPIQAMGVVGALAAWASQDREERPTGCVVPMVFLITCYWSALLLLPNVPGLNVGMLGIRKSMLALWGIVLGASIARAKVQSAWRWTSGLLAAGMVISIALQLFLPDLASRVAGSTQADQYTGQIDGIVRMHGIFAGPFHAALCGITLVGIGVAVSREARRTGLLFIALGATGIYLTQVRTAYVAVAMIVLAFVLLSQSFSSLARRILVCGVAAVGALVLAFKLDAGFVGTLDSIRHFSQDNRFEGRLPGWHEGLLMFRESPLFGWGPGAAGDVMDLYFPAPLRHVTSHNILLKFVVEGGVIGLAMFLIVLALAWRHLEFGTTRGLTGGLVLVGLMGLGLTGSAIETLPVSYLLFVLVGLGLTRRSGREARSAARKIQTDVSDGTVMAR
ncbi:hypothetical protein GCM10009798_01440 [Nocardioides panacihumi]|uniref:O-antigen ligase-related domain-containing protein n=1 Tax=Nocardioides panacihumi TaxID=400774 RepID=A0ABN2Q835_9ACTN